MEKSFHINTFFFCWNYCFIINISHPRARKILFSEIENSIKDIWDSYRIKLIFESAVSLRALKDIYKSVTLFFQF